MMDRLPGESSKLVKVKPNGEFVTGYDAFGWSGLGAPATTPAEIIKTLSDATNEALARLRLL